MASSASASACRSLPPKASARSACGLLAALQPYRMLASRRLRSGSLMGTIPLSSGPAARFAIEDVLWAGLGAPEIPKRTRREIARDLDRVLDVLTRKADRFIALLESLWN